MKIFFTVCNRSQLPNALALGASVLHYHPESSFYIGWADTVPLPRAQDGIKIISVEEAEIAEWAQMCSHYYDFELVAASRPWFAKGLLKKHKNCEQLTFFSPTTLIFKSISEISSLPADLLLTPHLSKPLAASKNLDDKRILNIGMFHSGSWIIKPNEETLKLLDWWAHRTIDRARFDLCNGMCMDQLLLNYAPIWVKSTIQISYAGWHYGLHSVLNKNLTEQDGHFYADEDELISADFAGIDNYHPVWSDHAGLVSHNETFKRLFSHYETVLSKFDKVNTSGQPGFGKPSNISNQRVFRRKIAGGLKAITKFIDQFQG